MTSVPQAHPKVQHTLRLRLKPKGPATGYVDGAWWPRSGDLTAELPDLAEVLAVRLGRVVRVAYALSSWDPAPRRVEVDGGRTRLEGFTYQDKDIVHVTGSNGGRISLLVVPPETAEPAAHDAMMTAAHRDNADRPADILDVGGIPVPRQVSESAAQRWESEGGPAHQHD
ncbi:DUF5994 family protein [Actinophytocola sp.]|jgi:hypothetical protein|uniref:DUF5994 family protein n=1 Tax=Actinophytocola sp. TaxID=1872138 RepID=UPI002D61FFBB|nr:DUF5994 family protein [Actinophytocola sp.]HYQ65043.1 DUF5994 family protein [Actinophytocola sp.]